MEKLILVNENDEVVGFEEKVKCHLNKGMLHRAFTVFLLNDKGQILIQKRTASKMLWPLYWETTCSSHPRENESYEDSGTRRLKEELGINAPLKVVDKFTYHSFYKDVGAEHEVCAVLAGQYNEKEISFNDNEVADLKWISIDDLKKELSKNPQDYAPWLEIAFKRLLNQHGNKLETLF